MESLGGDWDAIRQFRSRIAAAVASTARNLRVGQVVDRVAAVLARVPPEAVLTTVQGDALREVLRAEGGWKAMKRSGLTVLSGDSFTDLVRLLDALDEIGLFVVREGELERFAPGIAGHGPEWVSRALDEGVHREHAPVALVRRIHASFEEQ